MTCIDDCAKNFKDMMMTISSLIQQKIVKHTKMMHLKPTVILRFNTQQGKAKPVSISVLLDGGSAESLVTE